MYTELELSCRRGWCLLWRDPWFLSFSHFSFLIHWQSLLALSLKYIQNPIPFHHLLPSWSNLYYLSSRLKKNRLRTGSLTSTLILSSKPGPVAPVPTFQQFPFLTQGTNSRPLLLLFWFISYCSLSFTLGSWLSQVSTVLGSLYLLLLLPEVLFSKMAPWPSLAFFH